MKLKPEEIELKGQWNFNGSEVENDAVCDRIEWLVENQLKQINTDKSGWDTLYQDPYDNRFWELIYPQSHMHGGGPPMLKYLSNHKAQKKYQL